MFILGPCAIFEGKWAFKHPDGKSRKAQAREVRCSSWFLDFLLGIADKSSRDIIIFRNKAKPFVYGAIGRKIGNNVQGRFIWVYIVIRLGQSQS